MVCKLELFWISRRFQCQGSFCFVFNTAPTRCSTFSLPFRPTSSICLFSRLYKASFLCTPFCYNRHAWPFLVCLKGIKYTLLISRQENAPRKQQSWLWVLSIKFMEIHSLTFLFKAFFFFFFKFKLINTETHTSPDFGVCFRITFWKSLGLNLFWRLLRVFSGSPHWSYFLVPCFQPGRA